MLFNPRWNKKPSLAGFIAWLETFPGNKTYRYGNPDACLNAQYHAHIGKEYHVPLVLRRFRRTQTEVERIEGIAAELPHTFGAALERARKYA